MANGNGTTKADLQSNIDDAIAVLDDAYQPEVTREDLPEAVGKALEILGGENEDEDEADDTDDGGDDLDDDARK